MKPQPNCWIVISWYFRTSAILAKLLFWKGHITPGSSEVFNATSTSVGSLVSLAQLDAESENSKMFSDFITIYGSKKVFMVKWIGFLSGNLQVVWGNLQVRMAGVSWDLPIRPLLWLRCDSCITWVRKSQQDALQKVFSYRLKRPELLLGLPSYPEYQKRGATFGGTVPSSQTKCKIWTLKFFWANRWNMMEPYQLFVPEVFKQLLRRNLFLHGELGFLRVMGDWGNNDKLLWHDTVDGSIESRHHLRLVCFPIIYRVLAPSQVAWNSPDSVAINDVSARIYDQFNTP